MLVFLLVGCGGGGGSGGGDGGGSGSSNQPGQTPTINAAGPFSIAGNAASGTVIATLTIANPGTESWQWQIDSGAQGLFVINSNTGTISATNLLAIAPSPIGHYDLTVTLFTTGSSETTDTKIIRVTVEAPGFPSINYAAFQIADDAPAGEIVGTLTTVDSPAGSQAWTITAGDPNGLFSIDNSGQISTTAAFRIASASLTTGTSLTARYDLIVELTVNAVDVASSAVLIEPVAYLRDNAGTRTYSFSVQAGYVYLVRSRQLNCPTESTSACCVLSVSPSQPTDTTNASLDTPYQGTAFPGDFNDRQNTATLAVEMLDSTGATASTTLAIELKPNPPTQSGEPDFPSTCNSYLPVLSPGVGVADAESTATLRGQDRVTDIGNNEAFSLSLMKIGDQTILRDISRRRKGLASASFIESFLHGPSRAAFFFWTATAIADLRTGRLNEAAVDAYAHTLQTYDYLKDVLGIDSYDDRGGAMYIISEYRDLGSPTAFSLGSVDYVAIPPAGTSPRSYSADLDIVAHEWGHHVSDGSVTNGLRYERESGALSEAFSDWFGSAVDQHFGDTNWTIGEDVRRAVRDMAEPTRHRDPDTYQGIFWQPLEGDCSTEENDFCGVHRNSGVGNKMFYLLSAGGTHNGVTVEGIGIDVAMRIAYSAVTGCWTREVNYAMAGQCMVMVAQTEHSPHIASQVRAAWRAVRVLN